TQLTTTWNQNVTFNTGTIALAGSQVANATFLSGNGTPNLIFALSAVINQISVMTASVPGDLVFDNDSNFSVLMNNCTVTNQSTVSPPPPPPPPPPAPAQFDSGSGNWVATFTGTANVEIWGPAGNGATGTLSSSGGGGGGGEKRTGTLAVILGNSYAYSIGS